MSAFPWRDFRAMQAAGGSKARYNAMVKKGAAISAKAARARAIASIRNSITPSMVASPAYLRRVQSNRKELKGMDTILTQGAIIATTNTNANALVLNLVQQGAGSWNRIGKKIFMKSVRIKGCAQCVLGNVAVTGNQLVGPLRMVVVYDSQPNGGPLPTFDTIFGITGQAGAETSTIFAPVRYDATDRFKVIKDCTLEVNALNWINAGGTEDNSEVQVMFDEYIDLKNRETLFSGQTAPMTIADVATGALYIYWRTPFSTTGSGWSITDQSFSRLRYTD